MTQEIHLLLLKVIKSKKNGKFYNVITAYFPEQQRIDTIFTPNNDKQPDLNQVFDYVSQGGQKVEIEVFLSASRVSYGEIIIK